MEPVAPTAQDLFISSGVGVIHMCDYSLEMYASRPAREQEKYVTTRFPSGSIGLASPGDCTAAVCVQAGTGLNLVGISKRMQDKLGVGPDEEVVFIRVEHGAYRDGVKFGNGTEISLQMLDADVSVELVPVAANSAPAQVVTEESPAPVEDRVLELVD